MNWRWIHTNYRQGLVYTKHRFAPKFWIPTFNALAIVKQSQVHGFFKIYD